MLRTKERIQEIKETAYENLMKADNWAHNNKEMTKEKYWSLYRADVGRLIVCCNPCLIFGEILACLSFGWFVPSRYTIGTKGRIQGVGDSE